MLKKCSQFLIVTLFQLLVLVLMVFLARYAFDSMSQVVGLAKTLDKTRLISFLIRMLVYVALFYSWPPITKKYIKNPDDHLLTLLNKARFIFIGALLSIEILYWVGQL